MILIAHLSQSSSFQLPLDTISHTGIMTEPNDNQEEKYIASLVFS